MAGRRGDPEGQPARFGALATPVVMRTHGARVRAIESGEPPFDVAFIAAPAADGPGNLTGASHG